MRNKNNIEKCSGPGRPLCKIDWKKVDFFLQAGCSGTDVAAELGIHPETLYRRCEEENKTNFSEYLQLKKRSGAANILAKQYAKAIQGDNAMLIWVGKQQCGQRNEPKEKQEFDGKLAKLLDHLHTLQPSNENSIEKISS